MPSRKDRVKITVVMEPNCPHCRLLSTSKYFRALTRLYRTRVEVVEATSDVVNQAIAYYVGLSQSERLAWVAGGVRGSFKTPALIVEQPGWVEAFIPLAVLDVDGKVDEFATWLKLNNVFFGSDLPPMPLYSEKAKKSKKKGAKK